MKREVDAFEEALRSRLQDAGGEAPAGLWERLQADLDAPAAPAAGRRVNPVWIWTCGVAAAACLALGLVLGLGGQEEPAAALAEAVAVQEAADDRTLAEGPSETTGMEMPSEASAETLLPVRSVNASGLEDYAVAPVHSSEPVIALTQEPAAPADAQDVKPAAGEDPDKTQRPAEAKEVASSDGEKIDMEDWIRTVKESDPSRGRGWSLACAASSGVGAIAYSDQPAISMSSFETKSLMADMPADEPIACAKDAKYTSFNQPRSLSFSLRRPLTGRLALQTGLTYSYLSSSLTYVDFSSSQMSLVSVQQKQHLLGIPLELQYDIIQTGLLRLYAGAGASLYRSVYSAVGGQQVSDKGFPACWQLDLGLRLNVTDHLYFCLEPQFYSFFNHSTLQNYYSDNPAGLNVRLGFGFNI